MKTYTISQAAELIGVSRWTLKKAIDEGQIKAVLISKRLRVPQAEIERLNSPKEDTDSGEKEE